MVRYIFAILTAFIFLMSCQLQYKKCDCSSKNKEIEAYSEILNEIVDHRSYNLYLGEDEERIFKDYVHHPADTLRIDKEVIRLHNKIFNDTARFCTIYLDTIPNPKFNTWVYLFKDSSEFAIRLQNAVHEVSDNPAMVFKTVGSIQASYQPNDFTLCTSKMEMNFPLDSTCHRCCIGVIRLSKIFFNPTGNKGLLYYEYVGRNGNLLNIGKVAGRWTIISSIRTWMF
jgi:hypothetical protein